MIISRLLDLWDQATECYDNAMDYSDYNLANSIENYLDMLSEEILTFERQL
jgi:hypothetical protein